MRESSAWKSADVYKSFTLPSGKEAFYYSLSALSSCGFPGIKRLPVSIRIILESVLRHYDGTAITKDHIERLANWQANGSSDAEVPLVVSRVLLQDFTGVPLLVDLAAMRDAVHKHGQNPKKVEPLVPVQLVIDHSVQVDQSGSKEAFEVNVNKEFERNYERYEFLKWGQQAFETFTVVPPATGIVHQVNLEYLASIVFQKSTDNRLLLYFDSLVGTDSHTTMINGLGVVGWGVGGIEAELGMLGQPLYFQTPQVVGVHLIGQLQQGVTATDLTLALTELLRKAKVVGQFVEFFGEGAASLSVADRATIANMAPEYGATMGYFPADNKTLDYLRVTGRAEEHIQLIEAYLKIQGVFGMPQKGDIDYSRELIFDLSTVVPAVAGPKRPQDRIALPAIKHSFYDLLKAPLESGGYALLDSALKTQVAIDYKGHKDLKLAHGSVVIAAITSCTNTSNPAVMFAAGLLAKKAVEKGLRVPAYVKTSLAPGSRVVSDYLALAGLQDYLDTLGFQVIGYGCTTCIGNSGPLDPEIESALLKHELVGASVLSGNRNFEARVHPSVRANFLMSPPLVVAFALAGRVDINFEEDPLGYSQEGTPIYLKDVWPHAEDIEACIQRYLTPDLFKKQYASVYQSNKAWDSISLVAGDRYHWRIDSTYIQKPPFFDNVSSEGQNSLAFKNMRALAVLGDSVTTDHISPAGFIQPHSPAGLYLSQQGVAVKDFNSYGSRRGNDRVMVRGTFANNRIKNQLVQGREGGYTVFFPTHEVMSIYEAAERYQHAHTPLIIFAGKDYGMGSSRDWAAKGTALLGVKAVVACSFERIHRSNLIGMGILPFEFEIGHDLKTYGLTGEEIFSFEALTLTPNALNQLKALKKDGSFIYIPLKLRLDTAVEFEYYRHGGLLPYMLKKIIV